MKIAAVTVFCDERFRLANWIAYYAEYRDEISLHVIVDNGEEDCTELLRTSFPGSRVLRCPGRNMPAACNKGLRAVLEDPDVDAIARIVTDVRIRKGALTTLYQLIARDGGPAAAAPVLLQKDSDRVDCFGCAVAPNLDFVHCFHGVSCEDLPQGVHPAEALPGAVWLARRSYLSQEGFQDERLEMYADEIEFSIRASRAGVWLAVTSEALAAHQHVFPPGKVQRSTRAGFLMGRNPVLIARKYYGPFRVIRVVAGRTVQGLREWLSAVLHRKPAPFRQFGTAVIRGAYAGLFERGWKENG